MRGLESVLLLQPWSAGLGPLGFILALLRVFSQVLLQSLSKHSEQDDV